MIKIDIFASSDIHGNIDGLSGKEAFYKTLDRIKEEYPHAIFVDNGDYFTGSLKANYYNYGQESKDNPLIGLANNYFDIMIMGNHDIDFGLEKLEDYQSRLKMPYLSANLLDMEGNPIFEPYTIIEKDGLKVGFLGLVTSSLSQLTGFENMRDLKTLLVSEGIDLYLDELRSKTDLLILLYHGGFERNPETGKQTQYDMSEDEGYKILKSYPQIDGLVLGHQHRDTSGIFKENQTVYVQANFGGTSIGHLSFEIDRETKEIVSRSANLIYAKDESGQPKKEENFEAWLNRKINMEHFEEFLETKFNFDHLYIKGEIDSIGQMDLSFTKPYMVSSYYMTRDDLLNIDIVPKEEKDYYILLSNDQELPFYRLKERHVLNLIDGYMDYLSRRYKNLK